MGLQLPLALQQHILSFLPPNDRALSGRLVSAYAAAGLTGPDHCTASLSQPLPPHAVPWAVEVGQQHARQLTLRHKQQLLCAAAVSGSEVNLEVARAMLQHSVFPGPLQRVFHIVPYPDPGLAAAKAGHAHLLGWLMQHCRELVDTDRTLGAAAQYCDLAGLQVACEALRQEDTGEGHAGGSSEHTQGPTDIQRALDAAAGSATPDAVAKVEWLLAVEGGRCRLQESTATAAARSGDLGRLRWLREQGCPMGGSDVLQSALRHADLAVAEWLVGEAGCGLPGAAGHQWVRVAHEAAGSRDGVPKLQWLRERGAPPPGGQLVCAAAAAGQMEVVRHLLSGLEPAAAHDAAQRAAAWAVGSGRIPMVEVLIHSGATISPGEYAWSSLSAHYMYKDRLAGVDSVAMVRWLAREARASAAGLDLPSLIERWPRHTPACSRDLLEAVQLLVGEAGCRGWDAERALKEAAVRGDLALVQYLLQQRPGCRPGYAVLREAVRSGNQVLLEWLVAQHPGCLGGPGAGEEGHFGLYVSAAFNGDLGTLTGLRRLGVPWGVKDSVVEGVWAGCRMPALRWLVEQGALVGSRNRLKSEVHQSVRRGSLRAEDVAWLRSLGAA